MSLRLFESLSPFPRPAPRSLSPTLSCSSPPGPSDPTLSDLEVGSPGGDGASKAGWGWGGIPGRQPQRARAWMRACVCARGEAAVAGPRGGRRPSAHGGGLGSVGQGRGRPGGLGIGGEWSQGRGGGGDGGASRSRPRPRPRAPAPSPGASGAGRGEAAQGGEPGRAPAGVGGVGGP